MTIHKQSVSFTDSAFAFARELVDSGEYPTISAAVSGELARARQQRARDTALFEAEVQRRLALPADRWDDLGTAGSLTADARVWLARQGTGPSTGQSTGSIPGQSTGQGGPR